MRRLLGGVGICLMLVTVLGVSGSLAAGSAPSATRSHHRAVQPLTGLLFKTASDGWVGGKGFVLRTRDGGRSWARSTAGTGYIESFDFVSRRVGWALAVKALASLPLPQASQQLLRTVDGGVHWSAVSTTPLLSVDFLTARDGWAVEFERTPRPDHSVLPPIGRLIRTRDGGKTWAVTQAVPHSQSVCFNSREDGWSAVHNAIYHTRDGGSHWQLAFRAHLNGPPGWYPALQCSRRGTWALFAAVEDGAGNQEPYIAYKRSNTGWVAEFDEPYFGRISYHPSPRTPGPGNYVGPFGVLSPREAYFSGYDFGSTKGRARSGAEEMRTANGGATWQRHVVTRLDPTRPIAVSFVNGARGWFLGTGLGAHRSEILRTLDGGRHWSLQYLT